MDHLPTEILQSEIGRYLDIPSMISMSFVSKDYQEIYQPQFRKIVKEIDPYIEDGNVYDFLRITKIGPLDHFVYKFWNVIFRTMIKEIDLIHPYMTKKTIIDTFYKVVPIDAIESIRKQIREIFLNFPIFIVYKQVIYRNPHSSDYFQLPESLELDINDMIDTLLHELSSSDRTIVKDISLESLTDDSLEDMIEYFPYENISDSIENWIRYL
jgi:hypothetical protein